MARHQGVYIFIETDDGLVHRLADDTQDWWVTQNIDCRARAIAQCSTYPVGLLKEGSVAAITCIACLGRGPRP